MSAIDRLKEKIEAIKSSYETIQEEIKMLKVKLADADCSSEELDNLKIQLSTKDKTIISLRNEIKEKDTEIEAVIAKVEALLAQA